jgi:hypothetical protein
VFSVVYALEVARGCRSAPLQDPGRERRAVHHRDHTDRTSAISSVTRLGAGRRPSRAPLELVDMAIGGRGA